MEQESINSSINIKDLRNAFNFHVKCGEIYYLQPVNEVLIICNICNNENFDKYENFLQHFSVCYKKLQQKDIDLENIVNGGGGSILKSQMDFNLMDIAPLQLSESDDDDDEDDDISDDKNKKEMEKKKNDQIKKIPNKNGGIKTIPTIEIDDSESDSDESLSFSTKNQPIYEQNEIVEKEVKLTESKTVTQKLEKSVKFEKTEKPEKPVEKEKKKVSFGTETTIKENNISNISQITTSSSKNKISKKSKENLTQPLENTVEKVEKKKLEIKEKQNTSKSTIDSPKSASDNNMSFSSKQELQTNDIPLDPTAIFGGILPHIAPYGDLALPMLSNINNYKKTINPKYCKSEQRPHECPLCGKCFAQRINLVTHFRTHTGEKPYKCQMCDNAYPQKSNLDAHMLKHTGVRPYGCEDCGKRFFQLSHLLAHERTHTGKRPYKCVDCDRNFSQLSHLISHSRNTHNNNEQRLHKCSICPMQFPNHNELNAHHLTHINETLVKFKDFDVNTGVGTSNSTNNVVTEDIIKNQHIYLEKNSNIKLEDKIKSDVKLDDKNNGIQQLQLQQLQLIQQIQQQQQMQQAQQQQQQSQQIQLSPETNSKSLLNKDINNEEQTKRYECQQCSKKFYQSNHLAMHQRSHSGQKTITTTPTTTTTPATAATTTTTTTTETTCSKSESPTKLKFKFKQNALGTKRKHECDDCGKKFALVTELKVHQKRKH